jgi:hypothetical protein
MLLTYFIGYYLALVRFFEVKFTSKIRTSVVTQVEDSNPFGTSFTLSFSITDIVKVNSQPALGQTPPQLYNVLFSLFIHPGLLLGCLFD